VTISDPLTIPQVELIEEAFGEPPDETGKRIWLTISDKKQIPAILACVEKWDLANFPDPVQSDNFPASPRGESHKLIEWLFGEIFKIYFGETQIPNA
jgi:hypothetical protein